MQLNSPFRFLAFVAMTLAAAGAHATLHNIDEVLKGSSGFGASLFHSGAGMSGSNLADILSVNGAGVNTYDDSTGVLDVLLNIDGGTVHLTSSNLKFGTPAGNGIRTLVDSVGGNPAPIAATISADFTGVLADTVLNFTEGFQCCGSTNNDPNTFGPDITAPGSNPFVMTLWGSNSLPILNGGRIDWQGGDLGMDLRLGMSVAVPEPGTVGLVAAGLFALLLTRRQRRI